MLRRLSGRFEVKRRNSSLERVTASNRRDWTELGHNCPTKKGNIETACLWASAVLIHGCIAVFTGAATLQSLLRPQSHHFIVHNSHRILQ